MSGAGRQAHREFLNAYYRHVRHVYDASRRLFLFGRDRTIEALLREPWDSLVEVGPGTGRNLRILHRARPPARYGGVEASDEMLAHARRRCPWAALRHGFAEDADYAAVIGRRPDRILFSYVLSMVQDADAAIEHARRSLAPGGALVIVDFGDMARMPLFAGGMRGFLRAFHVVPPPADLLRRHGADLEWGRGRYFVIARMTPRAQAPL